MKLWFSKKNAEKGETAKIAEGADASAAAEAAPASPVHGPSTTATININPSDIPVAEAGNATETPPKPKPAEEPEPESKATAAKQPNARAQFLELINGLYDSVFILDDNGHVVSCNKRVEKVLGYTSDDLWDAPITRVVKGVHALIFRQMRDALRNSQHVMINTKCVRKDGTEFPAEVGVSLVHLMRNENLVFSVRNVENRVATIREQIAKDLRPKFPEAAAALMPQAKARVILKKADSSASGAN